VTRLYICGQNGSGTPEDPYRPEIADELPAGVGYGASQESYIKPRFLVEPNPALTDEQHAALAYSPDNPNGFDWLEVDGDEVTVHAAS
jgi:hypothetical protein